MRVILALAFAALIATSQAVQVTLAAGASTNSDFSVASAFGIAGPVIAASLSAVVLTNGNANAAVTLDVEPVLATDLSGTLAGLFNGANVVAKLGAGLKITSDTQGTGTLSLNLAGSLATSAAASAFYLVSTPVGSFSGDAAAAVTVPPTSSSFGTNNQVQWSVSWNRYYVLLALNVNANVGATVAAAAQAAFNTTSRVAANTYLQFSASSNAKTQTNTQTNTQGNAYVQFASTTEAQVAVSNFFFGASGQGKSYVAPANTNGNIGVQFSINRVGGAFNGNLTYNSNGRGTFNAAQASGYSWYKAVTGTASASGWAKVASSSSVDASGNLVVTAQQSGDFSEWTVAYSSASSVAAGALAIFAIVALLF